MNAEGRELPHWDLFKRRLWRTPGRWAIAQGVFWLVVTLWFPEDLLDAVMLNSNSWYYPSLPEMVFIFIALLGFAGLYYTIAQVLAQLTDTTGSAGWYSTPLASRTVLNGVLLTALAQASVTLFGLLAFLSARVLDYESSFVLEHIGHQIGGDLTTCYYFTSLFLLRLPHFALACACFCIAFRNTGLGRFLPLILAATATAAIFIDSLTIFEKQIVYTHLSQLPASLPLASNLSAMSALGLALVALLCVGLILHAHAVRGVIWRGLLLSPLLLTCAIDGFWAALYFMRGPRNYGWDWTGGVFYSLRPLHIFLTNLFPNLMIFWKDLAAFNLHPDQLLGWGELRPDAAQFAVLAASYLISLAIWYIAALACLNAARYPTLPWRKLLSR